MALVRVINFALAFKVIYLRVSALENGTVPMEFYIMTQQNTGRTRFGPSGNSKSFYDSGLKSTEQSAAYTKEFGLDIFEYSFGRGVNMSDEKAVSIGSAFAALGLELSVHAPYYINFANPDPQSFENSVGYIVRSLKKLQLMGGKRCVFHPGSQGKAERAQAADLTKDNIARMAERLDGFGLTDVMLCAETMGKLGQIGTVAEVCDFCSVDSRIYPCVDFGHINAREQGILKAQKDYYDVINYMFDHMEPHKVRNMHIHFSMIEYGTKGEIRHLDFEDRAFGPPFEPLMEVLHGLNITAYLICESAQRQIEDAAAMKNYYTALGGV